MLLVHAYFQMEEERTAVKMAFTAAGKGSTKSGNLSSCSWMESKIELGERILSNLLLEVSVTESKLGSLRYKDSESQGLAVIFKTSQDLEVKLSRMVCVFFSLLSPFLVSLTRVKVTWEEASSTKQMPPSDLPVGKSMGAFFWLMFDGELSTWCHPCTGGPGLYKKAVWA